MEKFIFFVTVVLLLQQTIAVVPTPRCRRQYEVYNSCGSACPVTCDNYTNKDSIACTKQCVPACYCADISIRNTADGSCCLPSKCPGAQPTCLFSHESYKECGTACPLTCDNYENPPMMCTDNCVEECQCDGEYVRNTADGSCCMPSECPK